MHMKDAILKSYKLYDSMYRIFWQEKKLETVKKKKKDQCLEIWVRAA